MNIEDFKNYCLSFRGAEVNMPFWRSNSNYNKNIMTMSIMGKWFCVVNIDSFECCGLKCDPIESIKLQEEYEGITPAYHMNKKHWINVYFNKDVPKRNIESLVKKSYELIIRGLTKKQREMLEKT